MAEGEREAAIARAEGSKQSAILEAEGQKQSQILKAEGEREAQLLTAEGYAKALTAIHEHARAVDGKTMALQYMEMLEKVGSSPSTKFVLPMELTSIAQNLVSTMGAGAALTNGGDGVDARGSGEAWRSRLRSSFAPAVSVYATYVRPLWKRGPGGEG